MIHHLALTLVARPEILERVLRITRHRGFRVCQLTVAEQEDSLLQLHLVVDSDRAITLLSRQLEKLVDVVECVVATPAISQTVNG